VKPDAPGRGLSKSVGIKFIAPDDIASMSLVAQPATVKTPLMSPEVPRDGRVSFRVPLPRRVSAAAFVTEPKKDQP
jgi:hypothetical protein